MLDREAKIAELNENPYCRDMLRKALSNCGKPYNWAERPINSRKPIAALNRVLGGEMVDGLLELLRTTPACEYETEDSSAVETWWKEATIYHIYVPSFMDSNHDGLGDFLGVARRLPYLESLGVNAIWLWPVLKTDGFLNEGALDFWDVQPEFGGKDSFCHLMDAAHAKGIRVIIGVDVTGVSVRHAWYRAALAGGREEDYFIFRPGNSKTAPNNWQRLDGDSAWEWCPEKGMWSLRTYSATMADLNWENAQVRKQVCAGLRFWTDMGIDGFFLAKSNLLSKSDLGDSLPALKELTCIAGLEKYACPPSLHGHLRELRRAVSEGLAEKNIPLLAGELVGTGVCVSKCLTGEKQGQLDMALDINHVVKRCTCCTGQVRQSLADLKAYYLLWMKEYVGERWMPLYFEDCDTVRMVSVIEDNPIYRSLLAKLLATMMFTLRGTPVLYQGSELGVFNSRFSSCDELREVRSLQLFRQLAAEKGEEEALRETLRQAPEQARTTMPWSAREQGGFSAVEAWIRQPDGLEKLNVSIQMNNKYSVLNFYRMLIELRSDNKALVYGEFRPVYVSNKNLFCYYRVLGRQRWYIEMNISDREIGRPMRLNRSHVLRLSSYHSFSNNLRPYEANIYQLKG